MRERLPETRRSVTHKGVIVSGEGPVQFHVTVGFFEDGRAGEVFISLDQSRQTSGILEGRT